MYDQRRPAPPKRRTITDRSFLRTCPDGIAAIFRYWDGKRGQRAMPRRRDIDPLDIPGHLPGVLIIDVEGEDDRGRGIYRYRLVGTGKVEARGGDPTGSTVEEGFCGPNLEDVLACYEMVRQRRSFLYDPVAYWTRDGRWRDDLTLFLPLSEDDRTVSQIFVYTEPRTP